MFKSLPLLDSSAIPPRPRLAPARIFPLFVAAILIVATVGAAIPVPATVSVAGAQTIEFTDEFWDLTNATVRTHLDRQAMAGNAVLKNVEFTNGVIEVDVAVSGARSYPGIVFRMRPGENGEHVYVRPHRESLYPDAVQYAHITNAIGSWQLCNGEGFTAPAELPADRWIHLKVEVGGSQARVFLDGADEPVLRISDLQHGVTTGALGLRGPRDGSAFFSNFSWRADDGLAFDPVPAPDDPPGVIARWEISPVVPMAQLDMERAPSPEDLAELTWEEVTSLPSGLVDLGRHRARAGRAPDCVLARATLHADRDETRKILFGYSDFVNIVLNGELLYQGNSVYRGRDPSFLGIIGYHDAVYLPLRRGENELLLVVAEVFGGWGFQCRDAGEVFLADGVVKTMETPEDFLVPESVTYDAARDIFYVSNYDMYGSADPAERQFISRVGADGAVQELKWVTGLRRPTGAALAGDKLWVAERGGVAEIDIPTGELTHHRIVESVFLNDAAVGPDGAVYLSDTEKHAIFKVEDGQAKVWIEGPAITNPNGLTVQDGKLVVGVNGDHCIKTVDLATKEITVLARMGPGIIDGLTSDGRGGLLASHWEGRVYRIDASGKTTKILDCTGPETNLADFAYVPETGLLLIPTFAGNKLVGYQLSR